MDKTKLLKEYLQAMFFRDLVERYGWKTGGRYMERLVLSEKPVFEAILQGLFPHQRLLLQALAKQATTKLLASGYIQKHGLGSVGGIQHSSRQLEELDLIEKDGETGVWGL